MYDKIYNNLIAKDWLEASPLGNGKINCLCFGDISRGRFLLNYEEWWYKQETKELSDISFLLNDVKRLFKEKKYKEANDVYSNYIIKNKWYGSAALYQPGILFNVEINTEGEFFNYKRELDMNSGICTISWTENDHYFEEKCFVSRKENIAVINIKSSRKFCGKLFFSDYNLENSCGILGEPFNHGLEFNCYESEDWGYLDGKRNDVVREENGIAYIGYNESIKDFGGVFKASTNHTIDNQYEVTIIISLYNGNNKENSIKLLNNINIDFNKLFQDHFTLHNSIYSKVDFSLFTSNVNKSNEQLVLNAKCGEVEDELIGKLYKFGRYLFIISTAENALPCTLTGKWNGDYFPAWRNVFFTNENMQLIYRQAYEGNMLDLILPLFDHVDNLMPDFKENAKKLFGMPGILLPLYFDHNCGLVKDMQPHGIFLIGAAGWFAELYYDYYKFSGDVEFLKNRAVPFMLEAYKFYKAYSFDENGNYYCISNSPENNPKGNFEGSGKISLSLNTTFDASILRELINNLLKCKIICNFSKDFIDELILYKSKIPDYKINKDGALCEWLDDNFEDNYEHRHLSHLYSVFPGNDIRFGKLFNAAKRALDCRLKYGLKDQTGWSLSHMACLNASFNHGDEAYNNLRLIARHCVGDNLFGYHNNVDHSGVTLDITWCRHAPHQFDVTSGFTAAIQEMIVSVNDDLSINIIPAIPKKWNKGYLNGVLVPNNILNIEWDTNSKIINIGFSKEMPSCIFPKGYLVKFYKII